ncbi:MAG: biotin/lipoyl-binding protein, partial [Chitinophagaceae bacterium]|nr:biotin/lipoyl-binding protein [Rubrivivax sp.]
MKPAHPLPWALCGLALLAACGKKPPPAAPPSTPQVGVYTVQPQRQAITAELPGRTSARLVAEIRPQVGGIVQQRLFEEGAQVRAGQALYQLDPASFQAAQASAQAGLVKAEASANAARATA